MKAGEVILQTHHAVMNECKTRTSELQLCNVEWHYFNLLRVCVRGSDRMCSAPPQL